jgi:hypothetical protein
VGIDAGRVHRRGMYTLRSVNSCIFTAGDVSAAGLMLQILRGAPALKPVQHKLTAPGLASGPPVPRISASAATRCGRSYFHSGDW